MIDAPPPSLEVLEQQRWSVSRQRRRLLTGGFGYDVERRVFTHFGATRASIIGRAVLGLNLFDRLCNTLAALYDRAPRVTSRDRGELPEMLGPDGAVAHTGIWRMGRHVQKMTIGCREMLLRPDFNGRDGLHVRTVYPDAVLARSWASTPNRPYEVWELRLRGNTWTWECMSIEDPSRPTWRVFEAGLDGWAVMASPLGGLTGMNPAMLGRDVTGHFLGDEFDGDRYPYRWTQGERAGQPFLPYVVYRAQDTGELWNAGTQQEAVDASLDIATAWTFFQHALHKASWPQRYIAGGTVAGATTEENGKIHYREIVTDPTVALELQSDNDRQQMQVGQWGPGANIRDMADAITTFQAALSNFDGLDLSHVVRQTSNDGTSAASLAILSDKRREAQATYEPQQAAGDLEAIEKIAAIVNRAGLVRTTVPEAGYRIRYAAIPLSPAELQARRDHNTALIEAGRMSVVDAYMEEHPGITRDEASRELARIRRENGSPEGVKVAIWSPVHGEQAVTHARTRADVEAMLGTTLEDPGPPHLTIVYLGRIDPAATGEIQGIVAQVLATTSAMVLASAGLDAFEPNEGRTPIIARYDSATLAAINASLVRQLAHLIVAPQFAVFAPHVTVGYLPRPLTPDELRQLRLRPPSAPLVLPIVELVADDRIVRTYPLKEPANG